jgi:hypothetical protein
LRTVRTTIASKNFGEFMMDHRVTGRRSTARNMVLAGLLVSAATLVMTQASAAPAGALNLAAGEARQVWLGSTYWWLRVCNDTTSKGSVTVGIDSHDSQVLAPGICTENAGGSLDLKNDRGGLALITYRSIFGYFQNGR